MSLIPWRQDPTYGALQRQMNRLFGDFFGESTAPSGTWLPAVDVTENPEAVIVKADVPGVDPSAIDIAVQGDVLELSGEKKQEQETTEGGYYRLERSYGSFRRAVRLPTEIDSDMVEATSKDGVLTIILPKREEVKPKKIQITAS